MIAKHFYIFSWCTDERGNDQSVGGQQIYGQKHGPNSKCVKGTLLDDGYRNFGNSQSGICVPMVCSGSGSVTL